MLIYILFLQQQQKILNKDETGVIIPKKSFCLFFIGKSFCGIKAPTSIASTIKLLFVVCRDVW